MNFYVDPSCNIQSIILQASHFAKSITDNENTITEIVSITSEIAYNIVKYSPRGTITMSQNNQRSVVIEASDTGDGFAKNFELAFHDGFSTGGSLGLGLPSLIRMSDEFSVTTSEHGTAIWCLKELS